ncbi:MAG: hypothetical protein HRT73_01000 [Flavobacteriales bacterium]|nr:hypothetical protein [Flavobacteriales bacterium]
MEKTNNYLVILTIVTGLMALYFIFKIELLLPIALGIAVISIASVYLTEKIVWVWGKIALILGTINSKILLSVIFYAFLVPIALLSRLFKKEDELILKKKTEGSYYKERNHTYISEDLENVF